jgi:glycosyltransferase involved in cell wall biosynthesis
MLCATPVVAAAAGGHLDIVEHGVNGLLVDARDVNAYAAAVQRLLNDPGLAGQLSRDGREYAESHYSLESHARQVMVVYDTLLGRAD